TSLSQAITNEARANWTSTKSSSNSTLDNFGGAQPIVPGFQYPFRASPEHSFATFSLSGTPGTVLTQGSSATNSQKQINVVDSVSLAKARHLVKVGVDVRLLRPVAGSPAETISAVFSGVGDPAKGTAQQTPGLFLSDSISSGTVLVRNAEFGLRYLNVSSFAQHPGRTPSRTRIPYGLRWDIAPPPAGTNGHSLLALSSLQSLSTLAFAPPGTALWKTDYKDFAPRIGIAHQI